MAATLAVAGCSSESDGGDGPGEVAATVDGVEIPSARIDEIVEGQEALLADVEEAERAEARLEAERNALSAEIQLTAVEGAVEERFGLDIPEEDIDAALEAQIEQQGGQEAFDQLAEEQGLTSDEAVGFAREGAYIQVLVEYVQAQLAEEGGTSEEELRAQYEANPEAFQTSTARHILVETEEEAQEVLDRLEAGEDFGELAQELSIDPGSGQNGGELGEAPRGTYVEPFEEAIYSEDTELGEVVGPVETQFGHHLIIVDERTTPTFEEVRPQLEAQLSGAAFTEFLDSVFADIEVTVDPYYGVWSPEERMVVPATDGASEGASQAPTGQTTQEPTGQATQEPTGQATQEPTGQPTQDATEGATDGASATEADGQG